MEREYEKTFLTLLTLEKESCGETSSKYFADDPLCPVRIRDTQRIRLFQDNDKNLRIEGTFTESSDNV